MPIRVENKEELYDKLSGLLFPVERLEAYEYPIRDPEDPSMRKVPSKDGLKSQLSNNFASKYNCERCKTDYQVDPETGIPLDNTTKCVYHMKKVFYRKLLGRDAYQCCEAAPGATGCCSNLYHVHEGKHILDNYRGFVETQPKPELEPNKHGIYALDCEMCDTTIGKELIRVTIINHKSEVVYEKLVKPKNKILDYNTKYSGIRKEDLDYVTTTLADVQRDLLDPFSSKTIIVGHGLNHDMKALKIFHNCFIDTAQLFPHRLGLPYKKALSTLMKDNLNEIIQNHSGHDSKEDAKAALRLVMWKANLRYTGDA